MSLYKIRFIFRNIIAKRRIESIKVIFIKKLFRGSFIDGYNELRSYEWGMAQLDRAGALGAYLSTSKLIAITDFLTFITNYIVTESDKTLLARVSLKHLLC